MIVNSLESAANSLLHSISDDVYKENEQKPTMDKFKLFCKLNGIQLCISDIRYQSINELIICRNEFVHPKPRKEAYNIQTDSFNVIRTSKKRYPLYYSEIQPKQIIHALEGTLSFLASICNDLCKFEVKEGALKLGFNSYGSTADIEWIGYNYQIQFDHRTFGKENSI